MSFAKVSSVLSNIADMSGDPAAFEAAYIVERARTEIPKILGKNIDGNVGVLYFKSGVLTLSVSSSVWAHNLRMRERGIIVKLNELFEKRVVKKIVYRVIL